MFLLELIFDWILEPLMDMLFRRRKSGKWHMVYLFPILTALGAILWWLGSHFEITVLLVFGVITTVLFGLFTLITLIPREVEAYREVKDRTTPKSSKVEEKKDK